MNTTKSSEEGKNQEVTRSDWGLPWTGGRCRRAAGAAGRTAAARSQGRRGAGEPSVVVAVLDGRHRDPRRQRRSVGLT
jgi:hypothetical protein